MWEWASLIHEGSYTKVVDESVPVSELPRWFEGVRLNFAENYLWSHDKGSAPGARSSRNKEDDKIAITEIREGNTSIRHITWRQLRFETGRMASALQARGVRKGDRVVVVGQHSLQTLVVFLATTWLGGLFSSSSTDMGVGGLLQRTVQINPKVINIAQDRHCIIFADEPISLSSSMTVPYITERPSTLGRRLPALLKA